MVQAVRHMRAVRAEIARVLSLRDDEVFELAKEMQSPRRGSSSCASSAAFPS